jgi:hypothetical protein
MATHVFDRELVDGLGVRVRVRVEVNLEGKAFEDLIIHLATHARQKSNKRKSVANGVIAVTATVVPPK